MRFFTPLLSVLLMTVFIGCSKDTVSSQLPPVPTFEQMVSKEVIRDAVTRYANIKSEGLVVAPMVRPPFTGDLTVAVYRDSASFVMRQTMYETLVPNNAQGAPSGVMSADEWFDAAKEVVRAQLKDPKRLTTAYETFKPTLLSALSDSKNKKAILFYLEDVVAPTLSRPVTQELLALYWEEAAAYVRAEQAKEDVNLKDRDYYSKHKRFKEYAMSHGFLEPQLLQWRLRRQAEGGEPLVAAWAAIANDLIGSMK